MELQNKDKIYWHGAFFEAIQLELHQYLNALTFVYEHARQEKHKRFFHTQKGTSNGINTGFSALL